jgi:hypothetical protein
VAKESDINALMTREQHFKARKWDKMFVSRKVITSKAFLALKLAASCQVYMVFLNKCQWEKEQTRPMHREKEWQITNNGKIKFTYDEALDRWGISEGRFKRAINELIKVGLIDITKTGFGLQKDKTLYVISERWQKYGTDEFVCIERPKRKQKLGFKKGNTYGRNCRPKKK